MAVAMATSTNLHANDVFWGFGGVLDESAWGKRGGRILRTNLSRGEEIFNF